jgi:ABC-type branched-subunit amino acid transport system substrate-binding protein
LSPVKKRQETARDTNRQNKNYFGEGKMKKISLVVIVSFLLLAVVLLPLMSACTQEPAEAKTLKIGLVTSVTGPLAPGLKSMYDAAKPTQDLMNQKGGITVNGQQYLIEIVVEDDKSSPPDAVAAANKLIQDGVKQHSHGTSLRRSKSHTGERLSM